MSRPIAHFKKRVYYGWFVTGAAAGTEFANAASAIAILTLFVTPMTEEFGWSRTQFSGATSLGAILGALLAPLTGRLVDRVGSRLLLAGGGLVVALACFYLAVSQTLLGFYVAFTLSRTADQGLIKAGASPAVGKWFFRRRGRAIAAVFFAGSAGILVLAPIIQTVIGTWGWRSAWVVLGGLMLAVGVVPSALLVRRQPEDMGLAVDGGPTAPMPEAQASSSSDPVQASPSGEVQWPLGQVVRTPTFWLLLVALFVSATSSSGVVLHLMPHLTQQGLGSASAVSVISVLAASGAVGTMALGLLAERVSPRLLMTLATLLPAASMTVLINTDHLAEAYLFAVLQGVASNGVNTLAPILWASYYGRGSLGSIYGISRASQVFGFAVGALFSGMVYDASESYRFAFILFAFFAVASSLLVAAARRPAPTAGTPARPAV